MAMALETRKAGPALGMKMNGITTGNVDRNTNRKTPSAPVKVRTMINPKRTSETRLIGSKTRLVDLMGSSGNSIVSWAFPLLHFGWQQVERQGKDRIHHQHQDPDEPRRSPAVRDE